MASTSLSVRLGAETCRVVTGAAIAAATPAYVIMGTPSTHPCRIMFIQNYTDVSLMFSFDGVNDSFPLLSNASLVLDITANKSSAEGIFLAKGQTLYVKELDAAVHPTTGSVYLSLIYGDTTL